MLLNVEWDRDWVSSTYETTQLVSKLALHRSFAVWQSNRNRLRLLPSIPTAPPSSSSPYAQQRHPAILHTPRMHFSYGMAQGRASAVQRCTPPTQCRPAQRVSTVVAANFEVRICTNRTCKSQGSVQLVQLGKDLGLEPAVTVRESGCLGSCGAGPNVAVIPLDGTSPLLLHHVATPAKLAAVVRDVCAAPVDALLLRATELRLAGNAAARDADLPRAIALYTQALELNPPAGLHLLLSNRSGARLAAGDFSGALADADAAAAAAPPNFTTAAVRRAEALLALGRPEEACAELDTCAQGSPEFGQSEAHRVLTRHARFLMEQQVQRAPAQAARV